MNKTKVKKSPFHRAKSLSIKLIIPPISKGDATSIKSAMIRIIAVNKSVLPKALINADKVEPFVVEVGFVSSSPDLVFLVSFLEGKKYK